MLFVSTQSRVRPPPQRLLPLTDVNNLGIIENVSAATLRNYSHQPGIGYSHRRNPHFRYMQQAGDSLHDLAQASVTLFVFLGQLPIIRRQQLDGLS